MPWFPRLSKVGILPRPLSHSWLHIILSYYCIDCSVSGLGGWSWWYRVLGLFLIQERNRSSHRLSISLRKSSLKESNTKDQKALQGSSGPQEWRHLRALGFRLRLLIERESKGGRGRLPRGFILGHIIIFSLCIFLSYYAQLYVGIRWWVGMSGSLEVPLRIQFYLMLYVPQISSGWIDLLSSLHNICSVWLGGI